jgi:hypothetical protein
MKPKGKPKRDWLAPRYMPLWQAIIGGVALIAATLIQKLL